MARRIGSISVYNAQEADGSYITNVPAYTYTDATSRVPIAAHSVVGLLLFS